MKEVADLKRYSSPTVTPQALAWDGKQLWMSSRDLGTLYRTELDGLKIVEEIDLPGITQALEGVCYYCAKPSESMLPFTVVA